VVWVVLVTVFFSASSSKLPGYILPVFPALALLIARHVVTASPRAVAASIGAVLPLVLVAIWLLPKAGHLRSQPDFELYFGAFLPWLLSATIALALGLGLATILAWKGRVTHAVATAAVANLVALTLAMTGVEEMSPIYSAQHTGTLLRERFPNEVRTAPFFSVGTFGHSLPFALERPVTLVACRGELELGIDAEPDKAIATLEKFSETWTALDEAFAVMPRPIYDELNRAGLPMNVVLEDPMRVFVRRR
jgi:4-amino-4-deoxy-L-arabinose transferase-like glycosyltransferase